MQIEQIYEDKAEDKVLRYNTDTQVAFLAKSSLTESTIRCVPEIRVCCCVVLCACVRACVHELINVRIVWKLVSLQIYNLGNATFALLSFSACS
jgi:hypothetical protein